MKREDIKFLVEEIFDDLINELENENTIRSDSNTSNSISSIVSNKKKIYISYGIRILIRILIIILLLVLSILFLISSISIKTNSNVTYKQESNIDYKVYLKDNDFYKEEYLDENMKYITSLIDYIDIKFNYSFKASKYFNYNYTYYIKSNVEILDDNDESKTIYSKTENIIDSKTVAMNNSNVFSIDETVKINYSKYNELLKAFEKKYGVEKDSKLTLILYLEILDEKGNKIKDINVDNMEIIIPLTKQMIDITTKNEKVNNVGRDVHVYKTFDISNKITFILSISFFIGFIVSIICLILYRIKTIKRRTTYDIILSNILYEYRRLIVETKKTFKLNDIVIDVTSFNELLDVRDNLEKPIIFSEIHRGQKSIFVVKNDSECYRYTLKLVDLDK